MMTPAPSRLCAACGCPAIAHHTGAGGRLVTASCSGFEAGRQLIPPGTFAGWENCRCGAPAREHKPDSTGLLLAPGGKCCGFIRKTDWEAAQAATTAQRLAAQEAVTATKKRKAVKKKAARRRKGGAAAFLGG